MILQNFTRSEKISFLLTLIITVIFLILSIFIPLKTKEKKYEDIQLTLGNFEAKYEQKVIKKNNSSESSKVESKKIIKSNLPKTLETIKDKQIVQKVDSTIKNTKPIVREEKLVQSIDDLMKQQIASKKTVEWDESLFADDSFIESSTEDFKVVENSSAQDVKPLKNSLSGTAAKTQSKIDSSVIAATSSVAKNQTEIAQSITEGSTLDEDFASSQNNDEDLNTENGDLTINGQVINWTSGRKRKIIRPKNPVLEISEKNQKLIDASKNLILEFTVTKEGIVSPSSFAIKPIGSLPKEIEEELKNQITQWTFESHNALSSARLNYRIEIR